MGRGSRWAVIRLNSAGIILKWKVLQKHKARYFQPPRSKGKGVLLCLKATVPGDSSQPQTHACEEPGSRIPSSLGMGEIPETLHKHRLLLQRRGPRATTASQPLPAGAQPFPSHPIRRPAARPEPCLTRDRRSSCPPEPALPALRNFAARPCSAQTPSPASPSPLLPSHPLSGWLRGLRLISNEVFIIFRSPSLFPNSFALQKN